MDKIKLPAEAIEALAMLEEAGFEGYVVGGCVRDYILAMEPDDIDITTNARPDQVKEVFRGYKVIETGIKHGTVTVIIRSFHMEITTYRVDGEYLDSRRPSHVTYTKSVEDDLGRRDFTINAMAYSPRTGLVDPYGGRRHIEDKLVVAVGDGAKRFEEDPLRILRGLRFSAQLGFQICEKTYNAMEEKKELLKNISMERIYVELTKTICGPNVREVLDKSYEIWAVIIPEILPMVGFNQNNQHHIYDVWTHTLVAMENVPPNVILRLAAFFHDIGKPRTYSEDENGVGHFYGHAEISCQIAEVVLDRLKTDKLTKVKVMELVKNHGISVEPTAKIIKRRISKMSEGLFPGLILLKKGDTLAQSPDYRYRLDQYDKALKTYEDIISQQQCFSLKNLNLRGRDLMELGYEGEMIGTALDMALELVIEEKLENKRQVLIEWAREERLNSKTLCEKEL